MNFLVDVCVSRRVAEYVATSGHDVALVFDRDPRLADADILAMAAREARVLVSNDKDFGRYIFLHQRPHAGLIRLPNAEGTFLVKMLAQVLSRHRQDLSDGAIVTVSGDRIRVRKEHRV